MPKIVELHRQEESSIARTPTLEAIVGRIEQMLEHPWLGPVLITGAAGTGKSHALASQQSPTRFLITMDKAHGAKLRFGLYHLAEALGIHVEWLRSTHDIIDRIIGRLSGIESPLLMFDECQNMCDDLIEQIRAIYDRTQVAMVFAGNERFRRRITQESFAPFFSRLGVKLRLNGVEPGDVAALCRLNGVAGAREHALLAKIAAKPGALRNVAKVIQLAKTIAGAEPVRFQHLAEAAGDLKPSPDA